MAKTKGNTPDANGVSNKLLQKLIGASSSKLTSQLSESVVMNEKDMIQTAIPVINIALSGSLNGGLVPGLLLLAGPSKHFKTLFMLIMMKAYLDKYPEAVGYLFDSEFGAAKSYFASVGIDERRVVHCPITDIEELKHEAINALEAIERGEKVFFGIDSVGNLASKKEVEDAKDGKSVADMTRAKAFKSFGRMVTPHLTLKDVPMVAVGHTYQTMEMFSKSVVSGGTGLYYSANDIWIIGRQQEKSTSGNKELLGFNFTINIEKSRNVKEKSKINVTVLREGGISRYTGIRELAEEFGILSGDNKSGFYIEGDETKYKEAQLEPFYEKLLSDAEFNDFVRSKYKLQHGALINNNVPEQEYEEEEIDD